MREKSGTRDLPAAASSVPGDDARTMGLLMGALFLGGAALGAFTLLLPHPAHFDDSALFSNCALALFLGVAILLMAGRLPAWSLQVWAVLGTLAVTRAIYYSDEADAYYSFFYLWITLYSFYFFGRFWGLVQMAVAGAAYGWVLTQIPSVTPVSLWLMRIGSLTVAGLVLDLLARRLREREAESALRARALAAVGSVAHELALRTTAESAAPAICEATADVTGASGASLWQPTRDLGGLEAKASTDPSLIGATVLLVGPPSGVIRAFNTREPYFVEQAKESPDVDLELVERLSVASLLFQPILRNERPVGVLAVWWSEPIPPLHDEIDEVVALLASEASVAIERSELFDRLERAARTDDLTGLPNRRAWDEHLSRELSRASRLGTPLCVGMLDLDHFKEYNDRHGHQGGDRFLKEAAAAWQGRIRDTDLIARYGGEEFAIALLDCELDVATEMINSLRDNTPEGESASAGVVMWDGRESEAELVARADAALYEAKRAGRDQVVAG